MNPNHTPTCSVVSDLMVLYTRDRTSAETSAMIRTHLSTCAYCAKAFGREPGIRGQVELAQPEIEPGPSGDAFDQARYYSYPVWAFVLYALTRFLVLVEGLLSRLGISTANAKIRLFRARRKMAGRILDLAKNEAETEAAAA